MPIILLVLFTDEQIIKLARVKFMYEHGKIDEYNTDERKRNLYLEWLYQSGRIKE